MKLSDVSLNRCRSKHCVLAATVCVIVPLVWVFATWKRSPVDHQQRDVSCTQVVALTFAWRAAQMQVLTADLENLMIQLPEQLAT